MRPSRKDNLTDVVVNLPAMANGGTNKPAGTVVASDGTRVTLGQRAGKNTSLSSAKNSMNLSNRGYKGR